ncbi:MAG: hypothetical protein ACOCVY_01275 [Patescibacteria group bacterium]
MRKMFLSAIAMLAMVLVAGPALAGTVKSSHVTVTAEKDRIVVNIQFDDKVRFSVPPPEQGQFQAEAGDTVVGHSNFGNSESYEVKQEDTDVKLVFPNPTSNENGSFFTWNASKDGKKQNWLLYPWEDDGFVIVRDSDDPAHVKGLHKYFAYVEGTQVRQAVEEAGENGYQVAREYHIEKGHIEEGNNGLSQDPTKVLNAGD